MRHRSKLQKFDRREAEVEFETLLTGGGISERAQQ
jgi:hypothetical protein